jgi:RNA polymerase sigma-70 factor (ECF subfamily)
VGTNVGTVKSRMNRARIRLAELMHVTGEDDLGADRVTKAVLSVESIRQGGVQQAA